MNTKSVLAKFQALALGLLLMGAAQSCNKEADQVAPDANALAQDCGTPSAPTPTDFCKEVPLVSGCTAVGTVGITTRSTGDVLVTYKITAPGIYLTQANLDVFSSLSQLRNAGKISYWGAFPSRFAFDEFWSSWSRVRTYTFVVPRSYVAQCGGANCFFVTAQATLSNCTSAWAGLTTPRSGGGVNLDPSKQFSGCSGSAYFEFCKTECAPSIDFTYAWEDLNGSANDSDYDDLVVQSDITKSATEMKINFLLTARGASFDHKFQFNIPKTGVTGIFGASSYVDKGTYYTVTVFENDRLAFGSNGGYVNVAANGTCTPFAEKTVTLTLNSSFVYNAAKPYEPFISVYYAGDTTPAYDLYIYEVSNRDTWTATDGKVYPNGIIIPADWRWPLEYVNIRVPYPNFTSLSEGFTPTWANTLADPSKTFNKAACNL
jgi:LruC domain-containing protein